MIFENAIHRPYADRGSPLLPNLWQSEQHARRPLSALIDPRAEKRDVVRSHRGESLSLGLGRHFRIRHVTRHVIDQWALLAVSGNDGRLPGCAAFQGGIPGNNAEKATRLFSAVTGDT